MCFIRNDDGKRSIVGVGHTTKHTLCFFVSCFLETLIKKDVSPRRCLDDNCLILFVESSFSTSHGYTMKRVLYARCYACSVLCCVCILLSVHRSLVVHNCVPFVEASLFGVPLDVWVRLRRWLFGEREHKHDATERTRENRHILFCVQSFASAFSAAPMQLCVY